MHKSQTPARLRLLWRSSNRIQLQNQGKFRWAYVYYFCCFHAQRRKECIRRTHLLQELLKRL